MQSKNHDGRREREREKEKAKKSRERKSERGTMNKEQRLGLALTHRGSQVVLWTLFLGAFKSVECKQTELS